MGYIFEIADSLVWSPSHNVARLFLASVRQLEEQIEMSSGLTEPMSDTIEVNCVMLAEFLRTVFATRNLDHRSMFLLLRGPLVHLLALLMATDSAAIESLSQAPNEWIAEANALIGASFQPHPR